MIKEQILANKKKIIAIVAVLFLVIILSIINALNNSKNVYQKEIVGKDYVFTRETIKYDKDNDSSLPFINLVGASINLYNDQIRDIFYKTLASETGFVKYDYYLKDDLLSLLIIVTQYDTGDYAELIHYSYNIDMDTLEVISNQTLLEKISLSESLVDDMVASKLRTYYNKEAEKQYIDSYTCDFDCYLKSINFTKKDEVLFLRDSKTLEAYYPITLDYFFLEDEESPDNPYLIKIEL